MWAGRAGLRQSCSSSPPCLKRCGVRALMLCAAVLLMMVQGCSWGSSTPEIPPLPVLKSLQRAELEGSPGLWMNEADAGTLAAWIYTVTGVSGL